LHSQPHLHIRDPLAACDSRCRCGKPDDLDLKLYTESTSSSEIQWEGQLKERLGALRAARNLGNDLYDLVAHFHAIAPGAQKLNVAALRGALTGWRSNKATGVGPFELISALIVLLSELSKARVQQGAE
jgi:hypothetical protein